jgi:hypothetical protein
MHECGIPLRDDIKETDIDRKDMVTFNGVGENAHETFYITRIFSDRFAEKDGKERLFAFCKTEAKPYDTLVTAVLLCLKKRFGDDVSISSDGNVSDWQPGLELCKKVLVWGPEELPINPLHNTNVSNLYWSFNHKIDPDYPKGTTDLWTANYRHPKKANVISFKLSGTLEEAKETAEQIGLENEMQLQSLVRNY